MNDPQFPRTLENCIRFGVAIMFTGVEEDIDPLMDNVIDRDIRSAFSYILSILLY